ncbi:alpha/beta hydrolase [Actinokineospora auranticolor]|nr:alpha/beta hydrolase [Actinokineospora auranticolor]
MWDRVRGPLSEHVRLITPEQRGFGGTDLGTDPPSLDTVAADALALLDSLDIDRALVGGCSMGGYVAMALLRAAPERVAGVLLVDTKAVADTDEARANRLRIAENAERNGIAPWLADSMLPALLRDPARADEVRAWMESQPGAAVAWAQRAMAARPDSRETLRGLDSDVLVVHGDADALMPLDLARDLADLTGGRLAALAGVGHLPPVEAPDAFLAAVLPWVRSFA